MKRGAKYRRRAALGFLGAVVIMGVCPKPFDPNAQDIARRLEPPSAEHWMGTDMLGRDLMSRVMDGARYSLGLGVGSALGAVALGTVTGAWAGFVGGGTSSAFLAILDVIYIFPSLLLSILMVIVFGQGMTGVWVALVLSSWVTHARLVWSVTRTVAAQPFVESAVGLGRTRFEVLWHHVLPQLWGPIWISLVAQIPQNILTESFLSFLGLGLQAPFASWGTLANDGMKAFQSYPHLVWGPGALLFMTLLSFQALSIRSFQKFDHGRDARRVSDR